MGKTITGFTKFIVKNGKFYYVNNENIIKSVPINLTKNKSIEEMISYFNKKYDKKTMTFKKLYKNNFNI